MTDKEIITKKITQVATTDISEMLNPEPGRRMELPGFGDEFVDFPQYIVRITDRIWHDREVELCLDWYAEDCQIHTLAGNISGAQTVVNNTWDTLRAFPDRRLDADNVIWSDEGNGEFYSSHLITSKMTNNGPSDFGPATGRKVRIQTIAECLCKENRVIEEWLVRDNLGLVEQLGFDVDGLATWQAEEDKKQGFSLLDFHASKRAEIRSATVLNTGKPSKDTTQIAISALDTIWNQRSWQDANLLYDYRVDASYPGSRSLYGADQLADYLQPLLTAMPETKLVVEHTAQIPYLGEAKDVSIRWSLVGNHSGDTEAYGKATGAELYILGVSQFRIMGGRIRNEVCIWDDLALRRQIASARLGA